MTDSTDYLMLMVVMLFCGLFAIIALQPFVEVGKTTVVEVSPSGSIKTTNGIFTEDYIDKECAFLKKGDEAIILKPSILGFWKQLSCTEARK